MEVGLQKAICISQTGKVKNNMAYISAGVATSHVPLAGAAVDKGMTEEDYFVPFFRELNISKSG